MEGGLFLRREALALLEETNPGERRYFLARPKGALCGIAVAHRVALNPLMYLGRVAQLRLWIVGVPCSVSVGGFHALPSGEDTLLEALRQVLGWFLILNLRQPLRNLRAAPTLPDIRMPIAARSFPEYWESLRSPYRRWLKRSMAGTTDLRVEVCSPSPELAGEIYGLYRSVYQRSPYKLECQGIGFFARFPGKLLLLRQAGECRAFALVAWESEVLSFVFCGFDSGRTAIPVYVRLLTEIVRYGIDHGFRIISFGQTAEETKLRLGGICESRYMHVGCRWRWLEALGGMALGALAYRRRATQRSVFRRTGR